jgi:hypothetical protein
MIWLNKIIEIIFSKWGWKDIWKYYVIWGDLTCLYYLYYYKNERCFCQYFGSIFTYMPIFFRLFFHVEQFLLVARLLFDLSVWSVCPVFLWPYFFNGCLVFFLPLFSRGTVFLVTRFLFDLLRSDPCARSTPQPPLGRTAAATSIYLPVRLLL